MKWLLSDRDRIFFRLSLLVALLWTVLALSSWRDLANGPRVGSPFTNNGYGQSLLFDGAVQTGALIAGFSLNVAAALLGYWLVVEPLWGRRQLASAPWLLAAGVVPGTLCIVVLSRVVTLMVPNSAAPLLIGALIVVALLAVGRRSLQRRPLDATLAASFRALGVGALAVCAALIFSVHVDRAHGAAEGSVWFINHVFLSPEYGVGAAGHWPIFSQHYDEAAFLYPVVYGFISPGPEASSSLTGLYWIMLSFGRLGMVSLTYVAIRSLAVDRLSSLILVAFVCGASLSLNPISSRVLFDSLSPLGYTLHISRFLVPVLPVLFVSSAAVWHGRASAGALSVAALLGLGLAAMPIHTAVVLPWAIAVALLTALAPAASESKQAWRAACFIVLLLAVAFSLTYALNGVQVLWRVLPLALVTALALAVAVWALMRARSSQPAASERSGVGLLWGSLCVGFGLGNLIFGNLFANAVHSILGEAWPWSGTTVVNRLANNITTPSLTLMQSPYCDEGYGWGFRSLTGHCGSLPMFVRTYGLPFVASIAVMGWWLKPGRRAHSIPSGLLTTVFWAMLLCLVAMPLGFVFFDFVSALGPELEWQRQLAIWLRSRLLEPWFYGATLLALGLYLRESERRGRRWLQSALMISVAVYALNPMILPPQLVANFAYLFRAVLD